jgi:hypothetical protein
MVLCPAVTSGFVEGRDEALALTQLQISSRTTSIVKRRRVDWRHPATLFASASLTRRQLNF